jgi:hypothetical protein
VGHYANGALVGRCDREECFSHFVGPLSLEAKRLSSFSASLASAMDCSRMNLIRALNNAHFWFPFWISFLRLRLWLPLCSRFKPGLHKLHDSHGARGDFLLVTAPLFDRRDLRRTQPNFNSLTLNHAVHLRGLSNRVKKPA